MRGCTVEGCESGARAAMLAMRIQLWCEHGGLGSAPRREMARLSR